jgi:hypothetical protein
MTDKDFLKHLKPGDEVCVIAAGFAARRSIQVVGRVTPSGRIVLLDGRVFNKDGYERGGHSPRFHGRAYMVQLTTPVREGVFREQALSKLKSFDWESMDNAALAAVLGLVAHDKGAAE